MPVLWQGHEAEAYALAAASNVEIAGANEAGYERIGMRAGNGGSGNLYSRPDWPAQDEIWHRFRGQDHHSPNEVVWAAVNAAGVKVAQIIATAFSGPLQYQALIGGVMTNVGATWPVVADGAVSRFDVHHKAANAGKVEVYYGSPGAQAKVLDAAGDYSGAGAIVRIYHGTNSTGGGFNTLVAHEVVQTTPTLATTSEIKPPTAQGTDADGTGDYTAIDEQSYSDADFITLGAVGQRQSFTSAARALTQNTVSGITLSCRAWYEAGGPTSIKPYLKIAGVRYYGTTFALDLIALGYQYTFTVNPATGVAFTAAEANDAALEYGWEAVA